MSVDIHSQGRIVTIRAAGVLDADDYERFVPELERTIQRAGPLRLLVEMADMRGWTPEAFVEDMKVGARHFSDIERLAIVGHDAWHEAAATLFKPFTEAEVRYFDQQEIGTARDWIAEGLEPDPA